MEMALHTFFVIIIIIIIIIIVIIIIIIISVINNTDWRASSHTFYFLSRINTFSRRRYVVVGKIY